MGQRLNRLADWFSLHRLHESDAPVFVSGSKLVTARDGRVLCRVSQPPPTSRPVHIPSPTVRRPPKLSFTMFSTLRVDGGVFFGVKVDGVELPLSASFQGDLVAALRSVQTPVSRWKSLEVSYPRDERGNPLYCSKRSVWTAEEETFVASVVGQALILQSVILEGIGRPDATQAILRALKPDAVETLGLSLSALPQPLQESFCRFPNLRTLAVNQYCEFFCCHVVHYTYKV